MDLVSVTWFMIYELQIDDLKMHSLDSNPTRITINQIYNRCPVNEPMPIT